MKKKPAKLNATKDAARVPIVMFGPSLKKQGKLRSKKKLGHTSDPKFAWVRIVCLHEGDAETPIEQWRALGEKYMAHLSSNGEGCYSRSLYALRMFFEYYAWRYHIYNPEDFLTLKRDANLPPLQGPKGNDTAFLDNREGAKLCNHLHDFLTWVIKTEYSSDEDGHPIPIPGVRVPFERKNYGGIYQPDETVQPVLPYKYMCELRDMLAPGTDFGDWKRAQDATGKNSGLRSGDWFEVDKSEIDENDPDCVWRGPVTVRVYNRQLSEQERRKNKRPGASIGTREVYYIWSPVAAVALLSKLEMPWRTYQVRMLDSGEADASCVELDPEGEQAFLNAQQGKKHASGSTDGIDPDTNKTSLVHKNLFRWVENPERTTLLDRLTRDQRGRVSKNQGVFWPCEDARVGKFVGFFINTNKTADADKVWQLGGYHIAYQHSSLLRWLVKLRNWQKKYNSLQRPTLWTELSVKHTLRLKSDFHLQAASPTCFLFRDASARQKRQGDETKPISDNAIDCLWTRLLTILEHKKKESGETDADGKAVRLIRIHRKEISKSTPFFPLHSLRVSWISNLADAGMKLDLMLKLVGHTRMVMTIY